MTQRHLGPEVGTPTRLGASDQRQPATSDDGGWVVSPAPRSAPAYLAKELWAHREMVFFLAVRDLQVRYKQATFGVLWAVLQPLAGAAVCVVVFSRLAGIESDGLPYLVFAFLGYAVWTYFASSLAGANAGLVTNSALVTKVYFPRLAAPLSSVLPGLVDLTIALGMTGVLMVVLGVAPGWQLLTLPVWMASVALLAFGVGTMPATLNVKYRDAHFAVGLLTQLWLFASPVAYPSSLCRRRGRPPTTSTPWRGSSRGSGGRFGGRPPGTTALLSLLVGLLLVCGGVAYFTRSQRRFADVI